MSENTSTAIVLTVLGLALAGANSVASYHDSKIEQACIAAGRAMRDGHCQPKGTKCE